MSRSSHTAALLLVCCLGSALAGVTFPTDEPTFKKDLSNILKKQGLTTLTAAFTSLGLDNSFVNNASATGTFFAPTNDAFNILVKQLGLTSSKDLIANSAALQRILAYHYVPKKVFPAYKLTKSAKLVTADNGNTIKVQTPAVSLHGAPAGNIAKIKVKDLNTFNGNLVVHVIDKILMPPKLAIGAFDGFDLASPANITGQVILPSAPGFGGSSGVCRVCLIVAKPMSKNANQAWCDSLAALVPKIRNQVQSGTWSCTAAAPAAMTVCAEPTVASEALAFMNAFLDSAAYKEQLRWLFNAYGPFTCMATGALVDQLQSVAGALVPQVSNEACGYGLQNAYKVSNC